MDQLGSKIQNAIEKSLNVKVIRLSVVRDQDVWNMSNVSNPFQSYEIIVEVSDLDSSDESAQSAFNLRTAIRDNLIDRALDGNGRLMQISTNMSSYKTYRSVLKFITHDLDGFANALTDLAWKAYSNDFDAQMTSKLSED